MVENGQGVGNNQISSAVNLKQSSNSNLHRQYQQQYQQQPELTHIFKTRYCNLNPVKNMVNQGQLILFDIKIKTQIMKLQQLPLKNIQFLQTICSPSSAIPLQDQIIKKLLQNYTSQYLNLFIIYYGDINFHLVSKQHYQKLHIQLFNRKIKLRIFTFFISKQALVQTFRSMNKINTLDHINDLVIQYYQMKREKKNINKIKKKRIKFNKKKKI